MKRISAAAFRHFTLTLICLLSIALGAALVGGRQQVTPVYAVDQATVDKAQKSTLQGLENAFVSIADGLEPTVVNITSEKMVDAPSMPGMDDDFFRSFPFPHPTPRGNGDDTKRRQTATGSGVIVKSDAQGTYVLTNDHVAGGVDRVTVKLKDGREFKGTVLRDPRTDLAVVKIDAKNLPVAKLGDSSNVKVGQWAIAIGNPFGLNNTLTVGVVSAVTREFSIPDPDSPGGGKYYPDAIQTDASINPGNSGGPLVNISGEIIGINSAIYSPSGGNIGVGFAVPSNTCKFVLNQLVAKGKVVRGYLGLLPENLSPVLKDKLGVQDGAVVSSVDDDTPASIAGIQPKDVITDINGKKIKDALDLRRVVSDIVPGTKIKVVLVRDKKDKSVDVTMGEAPDILAKDITTPKSRIGLSVDALTPQIAKEMELKAETKGVIVKSVTPGSAADRAGLQQGDVILEVEDMPTKTAAQFETAVSKLKAGSTAVLLVIRGGRTALVELTLD